MNTNTLLKKQSEEINSYLEAFKYLPHNKATVCLLIAFPILLLTGYSTFLLTPAYEDLMNSTWIVAASHRFPYYSFIFQTTSCSILAFSALSSLIEICRAGSLFKTADCTLSLKRLRSRTQKAEEGYIGNYSFDNIMFADTVFDCCKSALTRINGTSGFFLRIISILKFISFIFSTMGITLSAVIPLSVKFAQCRLFQSVFDFSMVFSIIAVILSIVCVIGILLTAFLAQDQKHLINPLFFMGILAGSAAGSILISLAVQGVIGLISFLVKKIVLYTITLLTGLFGATVTLFSGLATIGVGIIIAILVFIGLCEMFS